MRNTCLHPVPPRRHRRKHLGFGRLAVCAASCGPGNLHLINGVFDAAGAPVQTLPGEVTIGAGCIGDRN